MCMCTCLSNRSTATALNAAGTWRDALQMLCHSRRVRAREAHALGAARHRRAAPGHRRDGTAAAVRAVHAGGKLESVVSQRHAAGLSARRLRDEPCSGRERSVGSITADGRAQIAPPRPLQMTSCCAGPTYPRARRSATSRHGPASSRLTVSSVSASSAIPSNSTDSRAPSPASNTHATLSVLPPRTRSIV